MKNKRKISLIFGIILIFGLIFNFSSCGNEAPPLEEIKEEFCGLIESSAEVNRIFFGEGLAVYERDGSEESQLVYKNLSEALDNYESVREDCGYITIDAIKSAAEKVYTKEYLESVYQMVFDGYADEISGVSVARYLEWENWLYRSMSYEAPVKGTRKYNYDSMKIVKPSKGDYVNVIIESELEGEKLNVNLAFSKTENGWRLDTPTY